MALCMCFCAWPAVPWLRRKLGSTTHFFSRRPRAINYGATIVKFDCARWPSWTSFSHTSADPCSRIRVREHHIRLRVLAVMSPWWSLAVVARLSSRLLTGDRARRFEIVTKKPRVALTGGVNTNTVALLFVGVHMLYHHHRGYHNNIIYE